MILKEIDDELRAYKTPADVVNGLDSHSEFLISETVAEELRQNPDFMKEDYW